ANSLHRLRVEVRVFDHPEVVAEGVRDGRHLDAVAHVLRVAYNLRPEADEALHLCRDVRRAPVDADTARPRLALRLHSQLEPADVEPDVVRRVEVRRDADDGGVPRLGRVELFRADVNDAGAETEDHVRPPWRNGDIQICATGERLSITIPHSSIQAVGLAL